MKKIKLAQIGIGHDHAYDVFNNLKNLSDLYEIAGYALPECEEERYSGRLDCFCGFPKLTPEDIFNDPSITAVVIETEERSLTKYALLAAEAGKQIHMDKPGTADYPAFEKLIGLVKEKGLVFHVGYMYRYNPVLTDLIQKVNSGYLGEIFNVEAQMNGISPPTPEKRRWLNNFDGGMMFFLGCHLIDLIMQILGEPLKILPSNMSTGIAGVTANDYGMAILKYKNAQAFAKTCAQEFGGFPRRQLVICGTRGTAEVKPLEMHASTNGHHTGADHFTEVVYYMDPAWADQGQKVTSDVYSRYETMLASFAHIINREHTNPFSCDYELQLFKNTMLAAGLSLTKTGGNEHA